MVNLGGATGGSGGAAAARRGGGARAAAALGFGGAATWASRLIKAGRARSPSRTRPG